MPEVTGTFGSEHIELNNAATEATLKLLLVAMKASSKEAAAAVDKIAKNAGIDPETIDKANKSNLQTASSSNLVSKGFGMLFGAVGKTIDVYNSLSPVVRTLTSGSGEVGTVFSQIGQLLPGVTGKIVGLFG